MHKISKESETLTWGGLVHLRWNEPVEYSHIVVMIAIFVDMVAITLL